MSISTRVPSIEFITVTRSLASGVYLAEASGTFELSAVGPDAEAAREVLKRKLQAFWTDESSAPTLGLHRRRVPPKVKIGRLEVKLRAPSRASGWSEAAMVPVVFACWKESTGLWTGYAPLFQVVAFGNDRQDLETSLEKNVRLVLTRLGKDLTLLDLSRAEAIEGLEVGQVQVEVTRKSPKQLAQAEERQGEAKDTATLQEVAEEIGRDAPPAYELEAELQALAELLKSESRRSVLLVGPAGSGKTALIQELARRRGEFHLEARTFWGTSGARLMTGPIGYGMWQERCQKVCQEAGKTNGILHAGNLDELAEVGKTRRSEQSVGAFLRPSIARGELQVVAEVTPEQLARLERQEPQLVAAFQRMEIAPRTAEQTRRILEKEWEAASGERPSEMEAPETRDGTARLLALHERYGAYSARPGRAVGFLRNLLSDRFPKKWFAATDVVSRFSRETGMPLVLMDDDVRLDLQHTEAWLSERVIGQSDAVRRVVDVIATVKARLARPGKPLASLLFIGPTGVGKTELAKSLAEFFFGSVSRMTRFDLNQFNDRVSVQRLIGGPGGNEGLLTARIREQPFSVVLLDEFEKADPSFFDLLLQILGEGRLTDSGGRLADFSNCLVVMTSNLGAEDFQRGKAGFHSEATSVGEHFKEAVANFLRPEIFNRLDAIVPFRALSSDIIQSIAERYIGGIRHRHGVMQRAIDLEIAPAVVEQLAKVGTDPKYGARPLKRAVERELVAPLAEALLQLGTRRDYAVSVTLRDGRPHVHRSIARQFTEQRAGSDASIAKGAVDARRALERLKRSSAYSAVENQITLLQDLAERLKRAKWKAPEDLARLDRLPALSRVIDEVERFDTAVRDHEIAVLGKLYRKEPVQGIQPPKESRRELQWQVFEASLPGARELVLALYSEDKALLLEMLLAYRALTLKEGEVTELHYFLPTNRRKGSDAGFRREAPEDLGKFFASPPAYMLGVAMKLRGPLFLPRYEDESGLHRFEEEKLTRFTLIETATGALKEYQPPRGFELQGFLHAKRAPLRRAFLAVTDRVKDAQLGERPWIGPGLDRCIGTLMEERLEMKVKAATGGE